MIRPTSLFTLFLALILPALADGPGAIGNFGPTGIEIEVKKDGKAHVTAVQPGSPADGLLHQGDVIERIEGKEMPSHLWDQLTLLGRFITAAEAGDGTIHLAVRKDASTSREVVVKIPTIGSFSETRPVDCPKTGKIIAANAAWLRSQAADEAGLRRLAQHNLNNGMAILALLSTGNEEDLDVVRKIYTERMRVFKSTDTGPHTWNNGWQGIAACEYYLRTGDPSVIPLINAICESARKFQVNGGWTHWATGVNPQYVGGGLLNAAGTNLLTTLLLAKMCGADVNDDTLHAALRYFYRFVGHGANAYGDHRPEAGYGGINGKDQQLAIAMHIASHAKNGEVYAKARDRAALSTLYSYRSMLGGHTGPIGAKYHLPVAAFLIDLKPQLFRNHANETQWFHELSRRHDGAFVKAACARYNNTEYGSFMLVGLTAPMRTLQITGAPPSPHAAAFELPERPWGRETDLAFFSLDGGPAYREMTPPAPHLELQSIPKANRAELARLAQHPEHVFREDVARTIRDQKHFDLIEELVESTDPLARHTGCMAINFFQPWKVSASPGWISSQAITKDDFTPRMFNALIAMIKNENEALWLIDQAMIALALATPEQTVAHIDTLLPWLEQSDEWWLQESASIGLSPALLTQEGLDRILPTMIRSLAPSTHTKGRGYVEWMLTRTANAVSQEMKTQIASALKTLYMETPAQPDPTQKGDMDLTGISSIHLSSTLNWALTVDPALAADLANLSVPRLQKDMRLREINLQASNLIHTAKKLDEPNRKAVAAVLTNHYKPFIIEENRAALSRGAKGDSRQFAGPLQMILDIRELAGTSDGWEILGSDPSGKQSWHFTSFTPQEAPRQRPDDSAHGRYRNVEFPGHLTGWHLPDYNPANNGWKSATAKVGNTAPDSFQHLPRATRDLMNGAEEVLLLRKEFDLADIDYELIRLSIYTRQGFKIYLNGEPVAENRGRNRTWNRQQAFLNENTRKHLRKGRNVIAALSFMQYFRGTPEGGIEVQIEGLRQFPEID
ncbi:MAG: DUF6288 domain-containing protein [Luteolibacter sp.]